MWVFGMPAKGRLWVSVLSVRIGLSVLSMNR